jgi:phospholipase/carboxylesterase
MSIHFEIYGKTYVLMKKKNIIPGIEALDHHWINASSSISHANQYLMIVLHGRGDSLESFATIKDELQISEMNYLLVNAPRAYDGGFSWYAFEPNQKLGILKSRAKLLKLLQELALLGWPPNKIFFYGFSQGALLSCDLAMFAPQAFAGIIAISGYIYFFEEWKKSLRASAFQTPWLVTHGINDDALPVIRTREQIQNLKDVGLPIVWKEFMKDHEIDLYVETQFIRKWVRSKMNMQKKFVMPQLPLPYQTSSSNSKHRSRSF